MSKVVTTEVFTYDELSADAQARACDWYREGYDFTFEAETVLEDAATVAALLGITLNTRPVRLANGTTRQDPDFRYTGFWSQGDGASFTGRYAYAKGAVAAVKAHAPEDVTLARIAERLQAVQRKHFYGLVLDVTAGGHYAHEYTMHTNWAECVRPDGRTVDLDAKTEDAVMDELRAFARWTYEALRDAYDYATGDDAVAETIRANDYTFTAEGERFG